MTAARMPLSGRRAREPADRLARPVFLACAVLTAGIVVAVVGVLVLETARFFGVVSPVRFFTETSWTPFAEDPRFGILPLLAATAQITAGAAVFAVPAGLMTAVYLEHYAGVRTERMMAAVTMALAAVPTVVFGYLALTLVTPLLQRLRPGTEAFNGLAACLAVGFMILPTVVVLTRSALRSVPAALMETGLALGATRGRVVARVLIPSAAPGIMAAVLLAMARAAGETMIVTLAAGNQAQLTWSPLEGIRTLTAFIALSSLGDAPSGTVRYGAFFAVSAVLFAVTWGLHATGRFLMSRRRAESAA
ncbi:MAG: phosphate ABC transporter permease subunit PstC [Gemmatimonadetes bacterium]|nr:phosphate ABC transporter permease subunit PstC [Gemmatimonadota bacterium]MYB99919.1 phosphate ABC transporter permease subunit PstC [Gemmatimonadota bacterium]MYI45076.1 phosphate ABC transporter permease subunit PstC [Gemmatimonadota bacterium]